MSKEEVKQAMERAKVRASALATLSEEPISWEDHKRQLDALKDLEWAVKGRIRAEVHTIFAGVQADVHEAKFNIWSINEEIKAATRPLQEDKMDQQQRLDEALAKAAHGMSLPRTVARRLLSL